MFDFMIKILACLPSERDTLFTIEHKFAILYYRTLVLYSNIFSFSFCTGHYNFLFAFGHCYDFADCLHL
nr:MAG TPA: hypothetical protein [Bacteriophage sp.]